ncbi:hypothetical protein TREES_T100001072 [Tupaia chinensis]|uniref:Uncharacterized protein n=1 Tax=Tupaia chinensis TaxID=246437 RepID=L9JBW2_TUPCH|nr:hypothetical protein TREES_T100001072 [Tupaia chinensis]
MYDITREGRVATPVSWSFGTSNPTALTFYSTEDPLLGVEQGPGTQSKARPDGPPSLDRKSKIHAHKPSFSRYGYGHVHFPDLQRGKMRLSPNTTKEKERLKKYGENEHTDSSS